MAGGEARPGLERLGLPGLAPEGALRALESAVVAGATQRIVARVEWPKFLAVFESRGPRPLFERIEAPAAPVGAPPPAILADWGALAPEDRAARLRAHVQVTVARVLRMADGELPSVRTGFTELGVDSLLAVEIRNRLAADLAIVLPATLVFDHPEIERLASHLAGKVGGPDPRPARTRNDPAAERVARMSEEEAEAALLAKLKEL
jgi:hypothetical protein